MKNYINKILIFIGGIVVLGSVAFAATVAITSFTQTVNDGDTITSTWYNNVNTKLKGTYSSGKWCTSNSNGTIQCVNDVPSGSVPGGAIMAFYLSSCPSGWVEANGANSTPDLRGTFIRGMKGDQNGRDVARTLNSYQTDDFKSHSHGIRYVNGGLVGGPAHIPQDYNGVGSLSSTALINPIGGIETRPKNIALLYCMKQ